MPKQGLTDPVEQNSYGLAWRGTRTGTVVTNNFHNGEEERCRRRTTEAMLTMVRDSDDEGQLDASGSLAGLYSMADRLHA